MIAFWTQLLVKEMTRSVGSAYRLRMQALISVGHDPLLAGVVGDAVSDHLTGCGYTVIGDAIEALVEAGHARSASIALDSYQHLEGAPLQTAAGSLAHELAVHSVRMDRWGDLRQILTADLTCTADDRCDAAAIVAASLPQPLLLDLRARLPRKGVDRLRDSLAATRRQTRSPGELRDLTRSCERLAVTIAGKVTNRHPAGLSHWLQRALLDTMDPLTGALVLASSPYSHELSHHLERAEHSQTRPRYPGAALVLNTCVRRDPQTWVNRYRDGTTDDRRRLLVPLAHHRALPADIDLDRMIQEIGSAPRVLYAAGMSNHPGLATIDTSALPEGIRRATRWWASLTHVPA